MEIKPKRPRTSSPSDWHQSTPASKDSAPKMLMSEPVQKEKQQPEADRDEKQWGSNNVEGDTHVENPVKGLLGLSYASSDDDED